MSKQTIYYFLTATVLIGGIYLYSYWNHKYTIPALTAEAVKPDMLLNNTSSYYREHAKDRSISQLEDAIESIQLIEADLDKETQRILDLAIEDLRMVENEIKMDTLHEEDLDRAFSKVLNALTLAELKVSEALIETDHGDEALVALKYGMFHLGNALKYTSGKKKDYEIHIYNEIDSLLENGHLSHTEMIDRLEAMIAELDTLVEREELIQ